METQFFIFKQTWSLLHILLTTLLLLSLIAFAKFHWNRRRLYYLASKLNGPINFPLIGCGYLFLGSSSRIYKIIEQLSIKYENGIAIWLGTKLLIIITDADDAETILSSSKTLDKDSVYEFTKKAVGNGLFSSSGNVWKTHRKIISPTFNLRVLDSFVTVFAEAGSLLNEKLKNVADKGIFEATPYLLNNAIDIFCKTSLGWESKAQEHGSAFAENFNTIMEICWRRITCIFYHFDGIFNLTTHKVREDKAVKFLHTIVDKVISEKISAYEQHSGEKNEGNTQDKKWKPFLDYLIENAYSTGKFTVTDLRDEVNTFMMAGTDTTTCVAGFTLLMLGIHQDIQQKVYEEVMATIGPDRDVEADDLPNMKYLEQVIKETMRLFPVGPLIARCIQEDIKLKSFTLPAGCSVALHIHAIHKSEKYWPDPEQFDPDRFLPEEVAKRHPYAYMPFAAGSRVCIGMRYAMMSLKTTIATVVRKYKIYTPYKSIKDVDVRIHIVLKPCNGYKLSIVSR